MPGERVSSAELETVPKFWYTPTESPSGGDWPSRVKRDWVGTRLPVMDAADIIPPKGLLPEDPDLHVTVSRVGFVKVGVQAAVSALRLDSKYAAADFWAETARGHEWGADEPLLFRLDEGRLWDEETQAEVAVDLVPYDEVESLLDLAE